MLDEAKPPKIGSTLLAIVLWLATFGLGLESIYCLKELYFLIKALLGGSGVQTYGPALGLSLVLGLIFLLFIVGSTEYHWQHVGTRASWRLFAWSLVAEVSIIVLYSYIL